MRVAVVGGGITGVSVAYTLARRAKDARLPLEITVFESDRRLGGKVLTERVPGLILEGGPDSFLVRKPWMRGLCLELGVEEELVSLFEGRLPTFMRFRGQLRSIPAGLGMGLPRDWGAVLRSDLLSWRGKLRLAAERYVSARPGDADESLAEFARRRLGREAAIRVMGRCSPGSTVERRIGSACSPPFRDSGDGAAGWQSPGRRSAPACQANRGWRAAELSVARFGT